MQTKRLWSALSAVLASALLFSACAAPVAPAGGDAAAPDAAPAEAAPAESGIQIPAIEEGKFNVAFVFVGPVGDGGWTYAHNQGREYLEAELGDTVHTAYLESVPEGADAERVIRNLARAGFNAIFTTSFGFMDATETVAAEFPDIDFIHVSGFKKAENFGNLFGAMESMKYMMGMIAGARAQADGSTQIGYIAPFAIPEVIRHINATALGMRQTCPECTLDIRWIFTWFDPDIERQAAESLIEGGAAVVITGADTTGPIQVAGEQGKWGVGYDSNNACEVDVEHCLTVPYWNWGPEYVTIISSMMDGSFVGEDFYFDVDSGSLGLLGFMEGQTPAPGVPAEVIPLIQETMAKFASGELNRFSVFTGPINDNKGNVIVPEGVVLNQSDLEGISGDLATQLGREDGPIGMFWLAEGVSPDAELPE